MVHQVAELLSLAITPPTIIPAVLICYLWLRNSGETFTRGPKSAQDWFIIGVFCSFVGSAFDNAYWGVAWSASYLEADVTAALFRSGVYSNIPFRQMAGAMAGYCHIRAAYQHANEGSGAEIANRWTIVSFIVGAVLIAGLMFAKNF